MNYGNMICNKIKVYLFIRSKKSERFDHFWICLNIFLYCWCLLYYTLLFLMRLSDWVSFSVYMEIFERFFFRSFKKCPRSVNNSRTNCFCDFLGFGVLNAPPFHTHTTHPPHPRRQCQSSLPGKKI